MAEGGLVEGLLGGEGEEREADIGAAGPDAIAAAVAMDAARFDPELARQAADYLAKQGRLADLQLRHFDEERRLAIEAARRKRFADRIRNGLLTGTALVVLGAAAIVAKIAWDAAGSHDLVVEALSAPPDLAAQGLTGEVLASRLEDRLNALQAETVSYEDAARASGEAEGAINVKILETGVSFSELAQSLRRWLGHETHVSGEIIHAVDTSGAPALALTVRVGDQPGEQTTGPEAGVDGLVQSAAEEVYSAVSPFRYADWLVEHGRDADALGLLKRLAAQGTFDKRWQADVRLGSDSSLPFDQRQNYIHEAARLRPDNLEVQGSLALNEATLGHDETATRIEKAIIKMPSPTGYSAAARDINLYQRQYALDKASGDYVDALAVSDEDAVHRAEDPYEWFRKTSNAYVRVQIHDIAAARAFMRSGYVDDPSLSQSNNANREGAFLQAALQVDLATEDWNGVLSRASRLADLAKLQGDTSPSWPLVNPRAYALARLGRQAEAEALIATTPLDCYRCILARARIAEVKGDHAASDRWFAEAVRQGPSLPFAESEWGDALAARGHLDQAIVRYSAAHAKGPKFADPLKGWGDVLARQGQWAAALAKYDEVLKDAPAWVELQAARDVAAKHAA